MGQQVEILEPIKALSELKLKDKVRIRFAQTYTKETGWKHFYTHDYEVDSIGEKHVVFRSLKYSYQCHKMFSVGRNNHYEYIEGRIL